MKLFRSHVVVAAALSFALGSCAATSDAELGPAGEQDELSLQTAGLTAPSCRSPLALADVTRPTSVVGDGTPESCSEEALRTAVSRGGVITFACGAAKKTITLTRPLEARSDRDTVIDGGNRIVLDGAHKTQLLRVHHGDFRTNDHVLTVQRLTMHRGYDRGIGYVPRDGDKLCAWGYKQGGGGAIYARDMNLHVFGVTFTNNRGPSLGPDVAGGAVYSFGSKRLVVVNSRFKGNQAANGGAIGTLHTSSSLYNVVFDRNKATGTSANFANATGCPTFNHEEQGGAGGLGGAFYADGFDPGDDFCGVTMVQNSSGDLGGAVFRSAYWGMLGDVEKQTITWDRCVFENNRSVRGGGGAAYVNNSLFTLKSSHFIGNDSGEGDGGALKLTGLTVHADDVEFSANVASWAGAVAHWGSGPEGAGSARNVSYADNLPNDAQGDFPR